MQPAPGRKGSLLGGSLFQSCKHKVRVYGFHFQSYKNQMQIKSPWANNRALSLKFLSC